MMRKRISAVLTGSDFASLRSSCGVESGGEGRGGEGRGGEGRGGEGEGRGGGREGGVGWRRGRGKGGREGRGRGDEREGKGRRERREGGEGGEGGEGEEGHSIPSNPCCSSSLCSSLTFLPFISSPSLPPSLHPPSPSPLFFRHCFNIFTHTHTHTHILAMAANSSCSSPERPDRSCCDPPSRTRVEGEGVVAASSFSLSEYSFSLTSSVDKTSTSLGLHTVAGLIPSFHSRMYHAYET